MIKKFLLVILAVSLVLLVSCGDGEAGPQKKAAEYTGEVYVFSDGDGMNGAAAELIGARLGALGLGVRYGLLEENDPKGDVSVQTLCVITVGKAATEAYIASGADTSFIYCVADRPWYSPEGAEAEGVSPCLSSKSLAEATLSLVRDAEHFALISSAEGARDVQDACDVLDGRGADYTVETLDGRAYGEAAFSAAEKGSDVIIFPSGDFSAGGIDLSPHLAAVIAVGEGEPVKGALATFCVDTEALSEGAVQLACGFISGKEADLERDSYYSLCISESVASRLGVDIEPDGALEEFRVVFVE